MDLEPLHSNSSTIFKSSKVLKHGDLLKLDILTFVFNSITNLSPSCFQDYSIYSSIIRDHEASQVTRGNLYKTHHSTTMYSF